MQALLLDEREIQALIDRRRESGADRYDEVWEGVYVMSPLATNEHQRMATSLAHAFMEVATPGTTVLAGANVSDRMEGWQHNYRCPDVVVVLRDGIARDAGTHWVGGPDLVVEVMSPNDRSHDKLAFYAALGVREAVLVDRDTKAVEVFRLRDGELAPISATSLDAPAHISLEVVPLTVSSSRETRELVLVDRISARVWRI